MITDCGGTFYDMTDSELVFIATAFDMMKLVLPAAFFLFVWRAYVSNKQQPVMFLGLEETTASAYDQPVTPRWLLALYVLTSIITFLVGVVAHKANVFLSELLTRFMS